MASFIIIYIKLVKESKMLFKKSKAKAHNPEVAGSNPAPATIETKGKDADRRARPSLSVCTDSQLDLRATSHEVGKVWRKPEGVSGC